MDDDDERIAVYAKHWQGVDLKAWLAAPVGPLALAAFLVSTGETRTLWSQRLDVVWFQLEAECGFIGGLSTDKTVGSSTLFTLGSLAQWKRSSLQCCVVRVYDAATKEPLTDPTAWVAPGTCLIYITATVHALPTRQIDWRPPPYYWVHIPRSVHRLVTTASMTHPSWEVDKDQDQERSFGADSIIKFLRTRMSYALCEKHPAQPSTDCKWCVWHPRIGAPEAARPAQEVIRPTCSFSTLHMEDVFNTPISIDDTRRASSTETHPSLPYSKRK